MVANRPSSDDCSGWYRPNRIEFHEMTKSKKGRFQRDKWNLIFESNTQIPSYIRLMTSLVFIFSLFIQNVTSNGSYNNTSY